MMISNTYVNTVKRNLHFFSKLLIKLRYLKEHVYIHTKDKPYTCGIGGCNKRFRQAGKLSLHRRTHKEYSLKSYTRKDISKEGKKKIWNVCNDNKQSEKGVISKRKFMRKDSGQTSTSANPKEHRFVGNHLEEVKEDEWVDMLFVDEEKNKLANKELVKANPNEIEENIANTLTLYLNNIDSSVATVIRPKLPIPFKIQNKTEIRPPDLLKWIHIDNSKVCK